jgi:hypothetical protein
MFAASRFGCSDFDSPVPCRAGSNPNYSKLILQFSPERRTSVPDVAGSYRTDSGRSSMSATISRNSMDHSTFMQSVTLLYPVDTSLPPVYPGPTQNLYPYIHPRFTPPIPIIPQPSCTNCGSTSIPTWRRDAQNKILCNVHHPHKGMRRLR